MAGAVYLGENVVESLTTPALLYTFPMNELVDFPDLIVIALISALGAVSPIAKRGESILSGGISSTCITVLLSLLL